MPASGDDDSPMANRGCRPRSMRATRRPSRRATIARIEPPNPEPTMARSTSGTATPHGRRHPLLAVHLCEPGGAGLRAGAIEQPGDVPEIGEDSHCPCLAGSLPKAGVAHGLLHDPFEIAQPQPRPRLD